MTIVEIRDGFKANSTSSCIVWSSRPRLDIFIDVYTNACRQEEGWVGVRVRARVRVRVRMRVGEGEGEVDKILSRTSSKQRKD